jgi:hypothetical protein
MHCFMSVSRVTLMVGGKWGQQSQEALWTFCHKKLKWQTAEDVMVLPCDFTAVCHDSKRKKSTRQSVFNFQEDLNEGK